MMGEAEGGAAAASAITEEELLRLRREGVRSLHDAFARQAERARESGIEVDGLGEADLGSGAVRFALRRADRKVVVDVPGVRAGRTAPLRTAAGIATAVVAAGPESAHRLILVREGRRADWHIYDARQIAYRFGANHVRRFIEYLVDPAVAAPEIELGGAAEE